MDPVSLLLLKRVENDRIYRIDGMSGDPHLRAAICSHTRLPHPVLRDRIPPHMRKGQQDHAPSRLPHALDLGMKKEKMEELTSRPLEDSFEARSSRRRAIYSAGSVASAALANPARVSGREVFCFLDFGGITR